VLLLLKDSEILKELSRLSLSITGVAGAEAEEVAVAGAASVKR
jgi:hypothetical protein